MSYAQVVAVLSRRARTAETRRATEQALVTATLELLDEGSAFADLGIEQIVKRVGLSRPTFYAYFVDKRALILQLGDAFLNDVVSVAQPWFDGDEASARDTLVAVFSVFDAHRVAVRAITEAAAYDPDVAAFWQGFYGRFVPGSRRRILGANPGLVIEEVNARAYAMIYMTERTMQEQLNQRLTTDSAVINQLAWFWERATEASLANG